jgi:hypothetical protein
MERTLLVVVAAATFLALARPGLAATLCVGPQGGCFAQIQPAIAAAHDGDTITVARGTWAGGVTIDKSIRLQGAGAAQTVISGGGPVVTIGRATDPTGQTVSIDGVTVTGGVNHSQPGDAVTFGGGVSIPVSQLDHPPFNGTGATVSISNSVITHNSVVATAVIPPGFCGPSACAFNIAGGIENGGVLTLTNTRVTDNTAGSTPGFASAASDAGAGGIDNHFASTLVMRNSIVSGNHAVVDSPIANHADSGGIGSSGALDIENSIVSGNTVEDRGSMDVGDQAGLAGGISVDQCCDVPHPPATIRNTRVDGNRVLAVNTNPNSAPAGFGGGIVAFTAALLEQVSVSDNAVQVTGASFAGADGGGIEIDAPVTIRNSIVARNTVAAAGPRGAIAFGGGIAVFEGALVLERSVVASNSASGNGAAAPLPLGGVSSAFGGGISNGAPGIGGGTLTLTDSIVNGNRLSGSPGFQLQGGGVFTTSGVARARTVIAGNKPDDCFGC